MDRFQEEKEFFRSLAKNGRPSFLGPLEWIALECHYAWYVDCEPPKESLIKTIGGEYLRRVKTVYRRCQAEMMARQHLPTALEKFRKDMAQAEKIPTLPPQPLPWWIRD